MGKNNTLYIIAGIAAAAYIIPKILGNKVDEAAKTDRTAIRHDELTERIITRQDERTERTTTRQEEKTDRVKTRWEGAQGITETIFSKDKNKSSRPTNTQTVFSPRQIVDTISKVVTPNKYTTTPRGAPDYKTISMITQAVTAEKKHAPIKNAIEKINAAISKTPTIKAINRIKTVFKRNN